MFTLPLLLTSWSGYADSHQRDILLHVKWKGYDDPSDYTWEPEENLKCAHIGIANHILVWAPAAADTYLQGGRQ